MELVGTMSVSMFDRYATSPPLALDAELRLYFEVRSDRYYTVTTWPPGRAGRVFVDHSRKRVVAARKISKADQPDIGSQAL